ncbi:Abi family protein [Mycoplasma marinum]|uniref:Abi family protein n=1 Tax=Mycoplasma marinum TaxID=1937190 RepID=UPI001443FACB|nr:Abi family protein [Mycoplasma marinum]
MEEQIEILISRGIDVDDKKILESINYSHLIYKYGIHYLQNKENLNVYRKGVKLSHLYNLFLFNNDLSMKLLKIIFKFEHSLKWAIAYELTTINPLNYLNNDFYSKSGANYPDEIVFFIENMKKLEKNKRRKYKEEYYISGKLPLWLLVDEMAFGQLRMLLKLTASSVNVAEKLRVTQNKNIFLKYLITVNTYRNIICHANPLKALSQTNSGKKVTLKNLIKFIKSYYHKDFLEIKLFFDNFDFSKINIEKEKLIDILGLNTFFN